MGFRTLPEPPFTLANVTVPAILVGQPGNLLRTDLGVSADGLAAPAGTRVDMGGAMVFPCFTDMHTHLDKGHIWPRASNPDGSFAGALTTVRDDHANWSEDDLTARISFALRSAHAHGTAAIRTHLDSMNGQFKRSWPVFDRLRREWAGRIELQAACLVSCDGVSREGEFPDIADTVAEYGGVLGMVSYPVPDLQDRLNLFFDMAAERNLDADFHVDETLDPDSETLRMIARTVIDTGFEGRVVVGHCCSLSAQEDARAMDTLDLVARAGLHVVSLPMCNLYLQDRGARTPRRRGVTLVHEMRERGIPVSFASDNTRDPFYAYGDLDMLEVMREATRIAHLDHSADDWTRAFTTTPATTCAFGARDLGTGSPADLVVTRARSWTELFARPHSDRIVLRAGRAIDRTLPDYAELDPITGAP
ncbi:cytosine deaminase [Palleronia sp. LCG004]|uniref:cytosine deaminase n=1 Tax=Palleronia sp. LCG004 TaxID=3079304 RepID=UPI00397DA995